MKLSRGSSEGTSKGKHASWIIIIQKALIFQKGFDAGQPIKKPKDTIWEQYLRLWKPVS